MASERPSAESLPREPMARLLAVMAWLRDRRHGCPWDIDQTFRTIAPYTIEEAYEVADAIDRNDMAALKEELGDLLLQVVYHAQMASEARAFGFADVAATIAEKMIDRHPHVFGDLKIADAEAQTISWEARKAAERAKKNGSADAAGALDGVARALPVWDSTGRPSVLSSTRLRKSWVNSGTNLQAPSGTRPASPTSSATSFLP